jgi:hypothetical protein
MKQGVYILPSALSLGKMLSYFFEMLNPPDMYLLSLGQNSSLQSSPVFLSAVMDVN